ncbi:MAG TPA: hypothetical protein VHP83_15915, partial [Aggregatilineaceae bacterium]|nr:hypothetical protein [Aggregatilineaceae bacterium]
TSLRLAYIEADPSSLFVSNLDHGPPERIGTISLQNLGLSWSPDGQWIAFVSERGGNSDIYVIRPDGNDLINVSHDEGRDSRPTWSPDSRWITFESDRDGQLDLLLVRPDGSDLYPLASHPSADFGAVWSPDGRWIAFESLRTGNRDVWAVHPDGSGLTNVSHRANVDSSPVWSPPIEFPFHPVRVGAVVGGLLIGASIRRWSHTKRR